MSVGEILSIAERKELEISPNYQRLYRWTESQKTKFVESLLLGIPIPPIFVFQKTSGTWELIDGVQRISTLMELTGMFNGRSPLILEGTSYLPSLAGMTWDAGGDSDGTDDSLLDTAQMLQIRRARMRVEILKAESDDAVKYELFERLNRGGTALSDQEVRNCVLESIAPECHGWLRSLTVDPAFQVCTKRLSDRDKEEQKPMELVLRFVAFRQVPYDGQDVNDYLSQAARDIASDFMGWKEEEGRAFRDSMKLISDAFGEDAFRRYTGHSHTGKFLISLYEAISHGVAHNLDDIVGLPSGKEFVKERSISFQQLDTFERNQGMGVRGSTRLNALLPAAREHFKP